MPQLRHLLCSFAVLVMASAQSTPIPTINADLTSTAQTSFTLTDTSIAAATGSPPSLVSTTVHLLPPASTSVALSSSSSSSAAAATTTKTSSSPLSVPAIAGIAAGGAFILITTIILIIFLCIRSRRKQSDEWPELPEEALYRSTSQTRSLRRHSSAATLVTAPAHAYMNSKGSTEHYYTDGSLHHPKSNESFESTRSTILERVSEETMAKALKVDFGVPPKVELTPLPALPSSLDSADETRHVVVVVHEATLQKLCSDKSLPSSPEHEIPPSVLHLDHRQAMAPLEMDVNANVNANVDVDGRPRSSVYSTAMGIYGRDNWPGAPERQSQSFF